LVEEKAKVNITRNDGTSPLHAACEKGNDDICRLLIDHGARVGNTRNNGATALFVASDNGREQVVRTILTRDNESIDTTTLEEQQP